MSETVRIQSSDASRVSIVIGIIIAIIASAIVSYFVFFAHTVKETMTGFDPNRPVPDDATLRKRLSPEQYHVVRENGTETAFKNKLWDKFSPGIYVDVITREPLFSSADKFDGGTGRPTFSKPISKDSIVERDDNSFDMHRIEVRAKRSDAHLGHLIPDPTSPTGQRYAVNSAALYFIPAEEMKDAGYESFASAVSPATQK
ncbi:MAG TPA: peptide-methionine (R)-S-oxide reductase MsrB [Chthoniobacterales bacterium]|jgi:peptide methionine sulfoxide reductase msrA/msrB|nr:peptide-methionine (R)-S-oxide reductase MsrB [Chthoniobacterales bacterium]